MTDRTIEIRVARHYQVAGGPSPCFVFVATASGREARMDGDGYTPDEAVGNLIARNPEAFGVAIRRTD